jgi:hypothetical protein
MRNTSEVVLAILGLAAARYAVLHNAPMRIATIKFWSRLCCATWFSLCLAIAAEPSYIGRWKLDPARSKLTGETIKIEKTESGMRFAGAGMSYEFKPDGKQYPVPGGATASWQKLDPNTWETIIRRNGQVLNKFRQVFHADTMTLTASHTKPGGGIVEESAVWKRVSGGSGILGTWQSTEVKAAATGLNIAANGADGLTIEFPDYGTSCAAKFDGKDYPMNGLQEQQHASCSITKSGPSSFKATVKQDGKVIVNHLVTVDVAGTVLTDDGTAATATEPMKAVYTRQ